MQVALANLQEPAQARATFHAALDDQALRVHPELWIEAAKLESEHGEKVRARTILQKARLKFANAQIGSKIFVESVRLELGENDTISR